MAQFRKKPVVIEAWCWHGDPQRTLLGSGAPEWLVDAESVYGTFHVGKVRVVEETDGKGYLAIKTLEGEMTANPGDWIIKGVQGELYPCKPDIFAATYETVTTTPPPAGDEREPDRHKLYRVIQLAMPLPAKEAHELIDAILSAGFHRQQWRTDMENAPRDGTPCIVVKCGEQFAVRWVPESEHGPLWATADGYVVLGPSHWKTSPAPTAQASAGGEVAMADPFDRIDSKTSCVAAPHSPDAVEELVRDLTQAQNAAFTKPWQDRESHNRNMAQVLTTLGYSKAPTMTRESLEQFLREAHIFGPTIAAVTADALIAAGIVKVRG